MGTKELTKNRYSDEELEEFKKLIDCKLVKAKGSLVFCKSMLESNDVDHAQGFKRLEDAADAVSKEEIGKLIKHHQNFISHLEDALVRIENKTYGICVETGELINKDRLRAVPHAKLSISAKNNQR